MRHTLSGLAVLTALGCAPQQLRPATNPPVQEAILENPVRVNASYIAAEIGYACSTVKNIAEDSDTKSQKLTHQEFGNSYVYADTEGQEHLCTQQDLGSQAWSYNLKEPHTEKMQLFLSLTEFSPASTIITVGYTQGSKTIKTVWVTGIDAKGSCSIDSSLTIKGVNIEKRHKNGILTKADCPNPAKLLERLPKLIVL